MRVKFLWKRGLLLAVLLFFCSVLAAQAQENGPAAVEIRVMTFNIWVGGELVDFNQVVETIKAARADIVGLQEAGGNTRRVAEALGWPHANERLQIISRFPLIDPPDGNGMYIYAQINPGEVVALANVHLPSDPYGPYAVRDGSAPEEVLELEKTTRLTVIEPQLATLSKLVEAGTPVFLTGDFNTPSHRDWTEVVVEAREEVKYPLEWPVTAAVEAAGLQDTYRVAHPDPVAQPGITWTYGYPYPRLKPDEMVDRIDLVFAGGPVEVLNSELVGPAGVPDVDIGVQPFPSDHSGVVSTVRVTPVVPPLFVATDRRRVEVGQPIVIRYHTPTGEESDRIVLVPAGGSAEEDALMWLPPYEASFFGSVTFGSAHLTSGLYEAVLVGAEGEEVSRSQFWLVDPATMPTVSTGKTSYKVGEPITVTWENAPAHRWDWIGLYSAGEPDLYNGYWGYLYTQASVAGEAAFDAAGLGEAMLPPGEYELRLMLDDVYVVLATSSFTVTE
ncbi:MAG: endonuclease/exonuclease/phosphatase family protein [Anaerolineae bacterium]|nr:endonuclease/exonuclease/phosphatase family protein [Anaerolineae bacterium]